LQNIASPFTFSLSLNIDLQRKKEVKLLVELIANCFSGTFACGAEKRPLSSDSGTRIDPSSFLRKVRQKNIYRTVKLYSFGSTTIFVAKTHRFPLPLAEGLTLSGLSIMLPSVLLVSKDK
jgi:hypothetical protein